MNTMDVLSKVSLFSNLSHEVLYRLHELIQNRFYQPGEMIIEENKVPLGCLIIADGRVEMLQGPHAVSEIGHGEILDELSIFNDQPAIASIRALQSTHCLLIERWDFKAQMQAYPEIALQLLPILTKRLQNRQ
jgi:CRP-like cAMP-binding protein